MPIEKYFYSLPSEEFGIGGFVWLYCHCDHFISPPICKSVDEPV
jgi:hypothetical protein